MKRRADVNDSVSRKRQMLSTESSETLNIIPADSTVSLKFLGDFEQPGLLLYPDAVAKAEHDWKTMCTAYEFEKTSHEAALKRSTSRANDAEHNQAKALEAKEKLLEAKDKLLEVKDKALEAKDKLLEVQKRLLEANDKLLEVKDKALDKATKTESVS